MSNYPSEETLKRIKDFSVLKTDIKGTKEFVQFIKDNWEFEGFWVKENQNAINIELHTLGWSGNEDIVEALEKTDFWNIFWQSSERGGHYHLQIVKGFFNPKSSPLTENSKEVKDGS